MGAPWWKRLWRWLTRAAKRRARKIAREAAREAERQAVDIVRDAGERARDALDNDRDPPAERTHPEDREP